MRNTTIQIGIANLAEILGVHQRTLRIWDKEGILIPSRTGKNRRYYSLEDIKKAQFIQFLTGNLLVNLNAVKIILRLLEKSEINIEQYLDCVNEIAHTVDISNEEQQKNLIKNSKRGRKKKEE